MALKSPLQKSPAEISKRFRRIFRGPLSAEYVAEHALITHELDREGLTTWNAEILVRSTVDSLKAFRWIIPYASDLPQERGVYGLTIRDSRGALLPYTIKETIDTQGNAFSYSEIYVTLPNISKGRLFCISLRYNLKGYAFRTGSLPVLKSQWKYIFNYTIATETRRFEHRIVFPRDARLLRNGIITNHEEPPPVIFTDSQSRLNIVWNEENPTKGDLWGECSYDVIEQSTPIFFSILGGGIVSVVVSAVTVPLSWTTLGALFVVSFLIFFVTFWWAKRLF